MGPEAGKMVRRAATSDRLPELAGQPSSARLDTHKPSPGTAAKVLLPALKELASGLGSQHELVKEMLAAIQVSSPTTRKLAMLQGRLLTSRLLGAPCDTLDSHCAQMVSLSEKNTRLRTTQGRAACCVGDHVSLSAHCCEQHRLHAVELEGTSMCVLVRCVCLEGSLKLVLVRGQDAERGRQSNLTTLLAEVNERDRPKPSREEAERLKHDVCHSATADHLPVLGHVIRLPGLWDVCINRHDAPTEGQS